MTKLEKKQRMLSELQEGEKDLKWFQKEFAKFPDRPRRVISGTEYNLPEEIITTEMALEQLRQKLATL